MTSKRFSQSSFDRYRHVLAAALDAYPDAIPVDTSPLLASSFKQPCRDAITAWCECAVSYPPFVGRPVHELVVAEDRKGQVWVGKNALTRARQATGVAFVTGSPAMATAPMEYEVSLSGLQLLCRLLNERSFNPLPTFVVKGVPETEVEVLERIYPNIALCPCDNEPGKYQLI